MKTETTYKAFRRACTPAHVGRYLETCSDEEFAEVFAAFMKYRKTGHTELHAEDMDRFRPETCATLICDILEDVLFDPDTASSAWWKERKSI